MKKTRSRYTLEFKLEAVRLVGAGAKPVTPEQMELARLRAELAKTKMELDIVKKAAAYFAKHSTRSTHSSTSTRAYGRCLYCASS